MIGIALWIGLMFGAAIGARFGHRGRNFVPPEDTGRTRAERDAQRRLRDKQREIDNRIRDVQNHDRDLERRQVDALRQAREAAERASEAGTAFAPTGDKLIDLSQYDYPNSTVSTSLRTPGHELLMINTSDDFDKVAQFYQKKFGKPIIQINETFEHRLLFVSNASPTIAVYVEPDDEKRDQLKIQVLRLPFWIPKTEETQKQE